MLQSWPPPSPCPGRTFVAELAAPVGLAEALPGFVARAVDAAGVWDALVAVKALPAVLAPVDTQRQLLPSRAGGESRAGKQALEAQARQFW